MDSSVISVKLDAFDGPLDLLLHLIEKNKIDIFDIPIVQITEQYLEIIAQMDRKDMDVMSDFLVMAATLLKIKSKMLLPVEVTEEGEPEDPRAELVERLLEYKTYKYASYELRISRWMQQDCCSKNLRSPQKLLTSKKKSMLKNCCQMLRWQNCRQFFIL